MELLKTLCAIHAPAGSEEPMRDFVLQYVKEHSRNWKVKPEVLEGPEFQNGLILVFGKPRTAVFAHLDSIGFMVKYGKELVKIGGPRTKTGFRLKGEDSKGPVTCSLRVDKEGRLHYTSRRTIETGTTLTFVPDWRESKDYVQCCYMDNRLGVWNALKLAETLEDGIICFSCWEEHGGGHAEVLGRYIYENYKVRQALISDITWVTKGIKAGKGVAISIRDSGIPRRAYIDRIIGIARETTIPFQLEVEDAGGSDGNALQRSPYPFDWCFIGAPEQHVHSPDEKVHRKDIESMTALYRVLMQKL